MTKLGCAIFACLLAATPGLARAHGAAEDRAAQLDHRLAAAPRDREALVARAELALETGSPRLAIADLERVAELDGHGSGASAADRLGRELLLAHAQLAAGDAAAASVVIARVLDAAPAEPRALYLRARVRANERPAAAAADLERSIAATSEPAPSAYLELSKLHVAAGDDDRALAVLTSAAERVGALAVIVDAAVEIERRRGRFAEALSWNDRSEERLRVSPGGRARRAELLAALGRWSEAEEEARLGLSAVLALPKARRSSAAMVATEARLQGTVDAAVGRALPGPPAVAAGPSGSTWALTFGGALVLLVASRRRSASKLCASQSRGRAK